MRKEHKWKEAYEELNQKYIALYGEKQEVDYKLSLLMEEREQFRREEEEIRLLHQKVRQLKHDMKNHFMVIASYLNEEDCQQAKSYTSEILGKLNTVHSYIETGNSLMNHIMNEKLNHARQKQIAIKAQIENLQFQSLASIDFSALLTNLLDNAIESAMKEEEALRELHISIVKCRGYETICVKNKISSSVLATNPKLISQKTEQESHGYGLGKIKEIVTQANGMYDIYEEDSFFCVQVFIPT